MQILVHNLSGRLLNLTFEEATVSVDTLKKKLQDIEGLPPQTQRLSFNSKQLHDTDLLYSPNSEHIPSTHQKIRSYQLDESSGPIRLFLRLCGGKGGFGSLLRGGPQGVTIKKTTNFDACRDLSGRRMRHVNNEIRLGVWLAAEKERQLEALALEHIRKNVAVQSTNHALEEKFRNECEEISDKILDATQQGIKEYLRIKKEREDILLKLTELREQQANGVEQIEVDDDDEDEEDIDDDFFQDYVTVKKPAKRSPITISTDSLENTTNNSPIVIIPTTPPISTNEKPESPTNISHVSTTTTTTTTSYSTSTTTTTTTSTILITESVGNEVTIEKETEIENVKPKEEERDDGKKEEKIDLSGVSCAKDLEAFGHKILKKQLRQRNLPLKGNLQQRSKRLFDAISEQLPEAKRAKTQ
eukprot:TRINITY_DN18394_c0_g1_i1.p1 TRINITY_DN18394_c0_g1~~TRINITY_DN18394_c0_g1_i1.p1  ORF type:complete len:415 (-),score=110.76 TRINITY_DN18394_c0_g1_i1:68-1312(-)